ncbi:PREDICTED: uncharacterized protein LOC108356185 [Rhagoletis zephyria]|uniref:uncharacterized protein LOC108356185 n=1 Tax=Rhagoletis zephyria TaxID=28612 RepID=UPI000811A36B|nr:PREDICTED: uncharacterized protein LOC108356185 [Rhagoletis zephyria]
MYLGETKFKCFCRCKAGYRAMQLLTAANPLNIHLIGAISSLGVVSIDRQRDSFTNEMFGTWLASILQQWQKNGNSLNDLVIVCDNASYHSNIEQCVAIISHGCTQVLRLPPYSQMLNPIEIIWEKVKMFVKSHNSKIEMRNELNVIEQRLQYLENLLDDAKGTITGVECERAFQRSYALHVDAAALKDMPICLN